MGNILRTIKSLVLLVVFIVSMSIAGCGTSSSVDPVTAEKNANKAAVEKITEFAEKLQELKFQYILVLTADKDTNAPRFLPSDLVISNAEFNAFMNNVSQLYKMEAEVAAAFEQLGYKPGLKAKVAKIAPWYSLNGVGELFSSVTSFGARDAKGVADTLDKMTPAERAEVWSDIKSSSVSYGATTFDDWFAKLKKGEFNWYSSNIRNALVNNSTEYGIALQSVGNNKGQIIVETAAELFEKGIEVTKVVTNTVVPSVGTGIAVVQLITDIANKPLNEVVKDQIKSYATDKLGLSTVSDMYNTLVTGADRAARSVQQTVAAEKMNTIATDITTNTSGLGAVTVVDTASPTSSSAPSLVIMNNKKETALTDEEYTMILALMGGGNTVQDSTIPALPGNYDLMVVNPDGVPGVSQPVTVVEKQVAVAVVETSSVDPVAPTPSAAGVTASISPTAVVVGGEAVMTIQATETVIAPLKVTIANPNGALIAVADQIADGNVTFTANSSKVVANMSLNTAKTYSFTVSVEDAIGNTYTTAASITASVQPAPQPVPAGAVRYVGVANFTTDPGKADQIVWSLTVTTDISLAPGSANSGPVVVQVSGTGNGAPVSGQASGTWVNSQFQAYGKIGPTGGAAEDQFDFSYTGNYSGLTSQTLAGTISAFAMDIQTFTSNLVR